MTVFKTEKAAFKAAGDKVAALCKQGMPNCGLRVLKCEGGFKVAIVPERGFTTPFYI